MVNQSLRSGRSVATDLHSLHASAYGAEENEQVNEEEKFNQAFNFAVKTAEEHSVGSKPRSKIIMVSSQVEYERQAQTLAAYVKTMTDEFMSNFEFMQADLRKAFGRSHARSVTGFSFAVNQPEADIFPDLQTVEERGALKQHAEAGQKGVAVAFGHILAVQGDGALIRAHEAQDRLQQHRFAGA